MNIESFRVRLEDKIELDCKRNYFNLKDEKIEFRLLVNADETVYIGIDQPQCSVITCEKTLEIFFRTESSSMISFHVQKLQEHEVINEERSEDWLCNLYSELGKYS
jgi:hypothetical protein